jgi:thiamine transport system permease protein
LRLNKPWRLLYALPLLFLALFYFYPLLSILSLSLAPEGRLDLSGVQALTSRAYLAQVLWFTFWQAAASTALTLLIGLPAAYIYARYDFPAKGLLRALTTIPFVLPTVVVGAAFMTLLGPRGVLNDWLISAFDLTRPPINLLNTIWIILLAHAFYNAAVVVRIVGGIWSNLDPRLGEAAAVLGASRWRRTWELTLPLLTPSIAAASLLVFLFCFTSFGVVLILGGPHFATLEVEIYRQMVNYFNLPLGAVLALAQLVITFVVMAVYTRLQARASLPLNLRPQSMTVRRPASWREWLAVGGVNSLLIIVLLSPLLALAVRSVTLGSDGPTLRYYRALGTSATQSVFFVPPVQAIGNSLLFSLVAVAISLALGLLAAYLLAGKAAAGHSNRLTRWLDPIFLLPLGTSAVTLAFGYIVALDQPPLNLRTSPALIPLAYTLIAMPFVVRSILPALRGLNPRLRESAAVLGASPARTLREIDLPIIGRAVLVAAVFTFTISLGEFGATLLLYQPRYPTISVVIYRGLSQPGLSNYGQALAMSTLLMLICLAGLLLIERVRVGDMGEF